MVFNIDGFIYVQQLLDDTTNYNNQTFVIYDISQGKKCVPSMHICLCKRFLSDSQRMDGPVSGLKHVAVLQ
jgi:hypothetical protein